MRNKLWKLLAVTAVITGCGVQAQAQDAVTSTTSEVTTTTVVLDSTTTSTTTTIPVVIEIIESASQHLETAGRMDPPTTLPPPDPCGPEVQAYVNNIQYRKLDPGPSTEAYRLVGTCLGWDGPTLDKWQLAINNDVFPGESTNCPIIFRGGNVRDDCSVIDIGFGEDAGFFQLTRSYYGSGALLCKEYGVCDKWTIVATPWSSMYWGLVVIMHDGNHGWCYNHWSCNEYHPVMGRMGKQWP
jgi:hypothetical protein